MKAEIRIEKKAALLAGEKEHGDIVITFDPADLSEEQRLELSLWSDSLGRFEANPRHRSRSVEDNYVAKMLPAFTVADHDTLKDILNERIRLRAEFKPLHDEALSLYDKAVVEHLHEIVSMKAKDLVEEDWSGYRPTNRQYKIKLSTQYSFVGQDILKTDIIDKALFNDVVHFRPSEDEKVFLATMDPAEYEARVPGITAKVEEIKEYVAAKYAANKAAAERLSAEKEAKEKAEAAAKEKLAAEREQQIADWVAANGTENQKARFAEGLLPEKEVIDAIRAEAYAPLDGWPRYNKMMAGDVCRCEEPHPDQYGESYCEVEFYIRTPDDDDFPGLSDNEFERMRRIRESMPGSKVEPRLHIGEAEYCESKERKMGYMVRMTVGAFEFSREYE